MSRNPIAALSACIAAAVLGATLTTPATAAPPDAGVSTARQVSRQGYGVKVASFNILASTMRAGGVQRAHRAASALQDAGSQVVSFQEVARDQLPVLQRRLSRFSFFPQRTYGGRGSAIQVAWKRDYFVKRDTGVIWRPSMGHRRPIPWVLLENKRTDRRFFVIAIHNAPGGHEAERDVSTRREIDLIKRLQGRGTTPKPVFAMGDMNERSEFCQRVAGATNLVSMNDGTWRRPCPVPRRGGPDWMLGTGPKVDYTRFVKRYNGISDHPMLTARAWVRALS